MKLLFLFLLCSVTEVSSFTGQNIARNKNVIRYPDGRESDAYKAVDGDDYSVTYVGYNCRNCSVIVNLGESVYIRKIRVVPYNTINFFVLTSNMENPERPTLLSSDWTIRYFQINGNELTVSLYLEELSSHIAVYTERDADSFGVYEIEVYDYKVNDKPRNLVSSSSEVFSSSTYSDKSPGRALDENINMFDGNSFFSAKSGNTSHWWKVKLDTQVPDQCVVKVYPYLRRATGDTSRLYYVDIMLSSEDTPGDPSPTNSNWERCVTQGRYLFYYEVKGPVTTTCQTTGAKYLALYRNFPQALEIAEVQVYKTEPAKPGFVRVTSTSTSCVTVTSTGLTNTGVQYRLRCEGGDNSKQETTSTSPGTSCGYSPGTEVTCYVYAVTDGGTSDTESGMGTTLCDAPQIKELKFISRQQDAYNVEADVTWQAARSSCWIKYIIAVKKVGGSEVGSSVRYENNPTSYTYRYLEPDVMYQVLIVGDSKGQTSNLTLTNRTVEIPPVFGPFQKLNVRPVSSSCVGLKWPVPRDVNGEIESYKYSCYHVSNSQRTNVKNGSIRASSTREASSCGFMANKRVRCTLTAFNDGGNKGSNELSGFNKTYCGIPYGLSFEITNDTGVVHGRPRRNLRVSVIQSGLKSACNRIESYEYSLEAIDTQNTQHSEVTFDDLDAVTHYSISVVAINDKENRSEPYVQSVTTGELAPYDAPQDIRINSGSSCITLTYKEPTEPNGIIERYTIECNGTRNITEEKTYRRCGLQSASFWTCDISASTSIGPGPKKTVSIYTEPKVNTYPKPAINKEEGNLAVTFGNWEFANTIEIKNRLIIVEPGRVVANKRKRRSTRPAINKAKILSKSEAEQLDLGYYLTANLTDEEAQAKTVDNKFTFIVGDNLYYGGAHNAPLEIGRQYYIHYGITYGLNGEQVILSVSNTSLLVEKPSDSGLIIGVVVGSILGVALIVVIILLIYFIIIPRTKRNRQKRKTELIPPVEMAEVERHSDVDEEAVRVNQADAHIYEEIIEREAEAEMSQTPPIINESPSATQTDAVNLEERNPLIRSESNVSLTPSGYLNMSDLNSNTHKPDNNEVRQLPDQPSRSKDHKKTTLNKTCSNEKTTSESNVSVTPSGYLDMSDLKLKPRKPDNNEVGQLPDQPSTSKDDKHTTSNKTCSDEKEPYEEFSKSSIDSRSYEKLPKPLSDSVYENSPLLTADYVNT